jgi:PAS domain S-box-containing protein
MLKILPGSHMSGIDNYGPMLMSTGLPIAVVDSRELRFTFINEQFHQLFPGIVIAESIENHFSFPPSFSRKECIHQLTSGVGNLKVTAVSEANPPQLVEFVFSANKNERGELDSILLVAATPIQTKTPVAIAFANIAEQLENPILILKGGDMILEVANKALLDLWNVKEDSIGKSLLEILPEIKEQGFYDLLLKVYKNGETHHGIESEFYFKRPNGDINLHYFNFIYQPFRESNGEITGVLVIASDVTSHVIAKRKLAISETNFRNMINQAPVAMCILKGPEYVIEIANERMFEIWGRGSEELTGQPIFQALPDAKGQGFEELLNNVIETGTPFIANEHAVYLPRNNKVETRYLNFVYEAFEGEDGNYSGIIAVATDVTEQVIARKKIQLAEESARLAIESADLGTYEINLKTGEMFTSQRFRDIWGINQETNDRTVFASRIHPDDQAVREKAHSNSQVTGVVDYEARVIKDDKSIAWVRIKGKIINNQAGEPDKLLGVIQDISEQKQAAEKLSEKIEESTKELQESNDRLEKSNAELEQFAYVTSHDLQEPLRKIQFFTNAALQQHEMPPSLHRYVEKANESAKRMTDLIRGLLEYSRLSQQHSHFQRVDLNQVVSNVLTDFELMVSQKHAHIETDKLPEITAIPLQMNQLFFNVIGNALKFTKKDIPPHIRITCAVASEATVRSFTELDLQKKYFRIQVIDNGIGFSDEYANKIFTIFQRLNERSMYAGYGIGLAVCKKVVENHHGIIFAEGRLKEGAIFTFILPSEL